MSEDQVPAPATPSSREVSESQQLLELRKQIADLHETLRAISRGGVDAVIVGPPGEEQVYALVSADRPYRVIVESMGEGAVTVSEGGVILFANNQLATFLGVERNSMIGRDIQDYVMPEHVGELNQLLDSSTQETRRSELPLHDATGTPVPFLVAATDIDLEGVMVHCLVLSDLSMQQAEEQRLALETAVSERQRVAQEVNDTIVQGLVAAEMALDLGKDEFARELISRTSDHARSWIGTLAGDTELKPGMAVRRAAAHQGEAE